MGIGDESQAFQDKVKKVSVVRIVVASLAHSAWNCLMQPEINMLNKLSLNMCKNAAGSITYHVYPLIFFTRLLKKRD